jgi:hypothetical protein
MLLSFYQIRNQQQQMTILIFSNKEFTYNMKQILSILFLLILTGGVNSCIQLKMNDEMERILVVTNASHVKISYPIHQRDNGPQYGHAEVEITNPDIPSGKLTTPELVAGYISVVIKRKLMSMNNPVYSKIVVLLEIKGETKRYEYSVEYQKNTQ